MIMKYSLRVFLGIILNPTKRQNKEMSRNSPPLFATYITISDIFIIADDKIEKQL